MKKAALAFLLLCLAAFSSSSNDSYPVPDLYSFSLELTVPKTTIRAEEKVTFTAALKNLTGKEYTLISLQQVVWLHILPEGCEYMPIVVSTAYPTTIEPGGSITETRDFQTTIPGTYILSSYTSEFGVKEGSISVPPGTIPMFRYSCEGIPITVVAEDE